MPGRGRPSTRQVIQTVPVDPLRTPAQELSRPLQAELLDLLGSERGGAYLRDPHGEVGYGLNLSKLVGPLIDVPMIPVQREPIHRDDVQAIQNTLPPPVRNKQRADVGDTPQ